MAKKFNLGDLVKDTITGYEGVVVARTEWLRQCDRYTVQSQKLDKDGNPRQMQTFDQDDLVLVKEQVVAPRADELRTNGGPMPTPERRG